MYAAMETHPVVELVGKELFMELYIELAVEFAAAIGTPVFDVREHIKQLRKRSKETRQEAFDKLDEYWRPKCQVEWSYESLATVTSEELMDMLSGQLPRDSPHQRPRYKALVARSAYLLRYRELAIELGDESEITRPII